MEMNCRILKQACSSVSVAAQNQASTCREFFPSVCFSLYLPRFSLSVDPLCIEQKMPLRRALLLAGWSQKKGAFPGAGLTLVCCLPVDESVLALLGGGSQTELWELCLFLEKDFFFFLYREIAQ